MVYQDYDEDEPHAFDTEPGPPVAVGEVGHEKAHISTMILRKKCFGVPVVLLGGLFVAGLLGIGLVASQSGKEPQKGSEKEKVQVAEPTPSPTPDRTAHPTAAPHPAVPTPKPTLMPSHEHLETDSTWVQLGDDVGGISSAQGNFGISVGISYNGDTFAEGSHSAMGMDASTGHVRVYKYNEQKNSWYTVGSDILGKKDGDEFGWAIDLSKDGTMVAVGAPGAYRHGGEKKNVGYFQVHKWNATIQDWSPYGQDKWGEGDGDRAGADIAISRGGGVVVVGSPGSSRNKPQAGEVRVFEWSTAFGKYMRHGNELTGHDAGDQFGFSVAISVESDIVAVGAPYASDADKNHSGHVQIFKFLQIPKPSGVGRFRRFHRESRRLKGRDAGDNFGYSIALSADGSIIAAGAPAAPYQGTLAVGYVEVYQYYVDDRGAHWHRLGNTIYGVHSHEGFGKSVELSMDGKILIVGAPDKSDSTGAIRVFKYNEDANTWEQVGKAMEGDGPYDYFGNAVAASADGRTIVSGGNNYLDAGREEAHVRVFRGM